MSYLDQLQRGIDFIEERLDEDIALGEVAKAAGISQWHFQRIFHALTKETLKTYIRSRRLARSLDKLLYSEERIIEIALAAGFESQQSFTRAFKRAFGITPKAYRNLGENSLFLKKARFDRGYIEHVGENVSLEPVIYQQSAITLVGLQTVFYGPGSDKNNIADKLIPLWSALLERALEVGDQLDHAYGIVRQDPIDGERIDYLAAFSVEPSSRAELPAQMSRQTIEGGLYAKFTHRGDPRLLDQTVSYIYSSWLLRSSYRHTYGPDLEIYGPDYIQDSDSSVMAYAIPIVAA